MKKICCLPHGVEFFTAPGVEGAGGFPRKGELHGMMQNGLSLSLMDFSWDELHFL